MTTILLTIHFLICAALVATVLLQRSEGGALGIGGGPGSMMSGRSATNVLTRSTSILGALFFASSILLTVLPSLGGSADSVVIGAPASELPATLPEPATKDDAASQPAPEEEE